jgi:hypothetical protein
MTTRKKAAPDPWGAVQTTTLDNGQPVTVWENASTGEQRVVPQGIHPAQQPLAEVVRLEPDQEEIEETATDRVASILRRAHDSGGGQLRVYKIDKGSLVWCETYTPEQFEAGDLPMLRDTFGPGDYELRLYGPHPVTSKYGVIAKTRVVIAQALKTAPDMRRDDGLAQVLSTIAEGQRAMLQALTERPQAKDPTEEMTKMLGLMVTMRQAMGIDAQPRSQITEIVSAIRELREASEEINPDKEPPDSLLGALPQVLDVVKAGMAQQQPQAQPMPLVELPPSMASAPTPQPEPVYQAVQQPQPNQEQEVFNPLVLIQLKAYLKTLLNMAQTKKAIEAGAKFVYDKMPDEIVELMTLDNWFELLLEVAPECKSHKEWLTQVRDQALAMFDQVDEGDDDKAA